MDDPGFGKFWRRPLSETDGCGSGRRIAAENLGRIFEPYFTTKKTGSGLGLATVYSIVKKHLGHVSVESTVAHGTSFHIWLPAAAAAPELIPEEIPLVKTGRGRVLFMDDEAEIRRLGAAMLRRLGYEATTVSNATKPSRSIAAVLERLRALMSSYWTSLSPEEKGDVKQWKRCFGLIPRQRGSFRVVIRMMRYFRTTEPMGFQAL